MIELVARRAYFDDYAERIGDMPPSLRVYGLRFTCPCCGYPTLKMRGLDGICFLCSWEDDGQDDDDADDVRIGPNRGLSLSDARVNFAAEDAIRGGVIDAFDEMRSVPSSDHERLWEIVLAGERELSRLLVQRVGMDRAL